MKKRILGFLLALCLIIGLLPAIALADGAAAVPVTLKIWDKNSTKNNVPTINFEAEAGKVYYATTTDGAISQFTETNPGDGKWNVKLDNSKNPAVLTMDNMVLDTCHTVGSAAAWENGGKTVQGVFTVAGEGALEIRVKSDSTIHLAGLGGLTTKMAGGTTITCDVVNGERALLTAVHSERVDTNVTYNAIRETVGSLTIKDANIRGRISNNAGDAFIRDCIYAKGDLVIDNSKIVTESVYGQARGMRAEGNLIIQNNSDVSIYNRGDKYAIEVGGEFKIDNSTVKIFNYSFNTAAYYINKMPTLVGVSAKYNNEQVTTKAWEQYDEITAWTKLDLAAGTDMTTGHAYFNYIFAGCLHANAGKQTDCSVAVTCPDCNATIAAAKDHTPEADDGDCTTAVKCTVCGKETTAAAAHTGGTATCTAKAVCTVCNKEYGEKAPHTPKEGTYACSVAHPCATCDGNYREAGAHIGGTATCQAKAKCTNCGEEYGELAACTPAADDGDCTTAVKCTVCGKETTAAQAAHKFTNDKDASCDNAGCTHTRVVTPDNPQTGDSTPVVLFVALAVLAAVAVIFTKKRAII